MKIIFLNRYFHPDHSATSQMLSDLAFYLAGRGHEIHVITSRQRYDEARANLVPQEYINGVTIHRVWTSIFGRSFLPGRLLDYLSFYLCCCWRLFRICRQGDIVVAMTDPPMLSVAVGVVTRLRKAKLVNWLQDLFPEVAMALHLWGFNAVTTNILQWLRNRSLHSAKMNVVVGEEMQSRLLSEDIPSGKISIIHNWADGDLIKPLARDNNPLVREWGLQDKFIIGYSGNFGRGHEFATILDAAENLKDYQDIIFLFIGGGEKFAMISSEQRRRALGNIIFKPYQEREMLCFSLGLPDIHLITLRPEMTGLMVPSKFYGIAAAGKPMVFIGAEHCEIAQIIRATGCGDCIEAGEVDVLTGVILHLRQNPAVLMDMGKWARQIFDERYSSGRALKQWEMLLSEIDGRD
jgi:glycosyltransferase involved in cell wall biosynthesis